MTASRLLQYIVLAAACWACSVSSVSLLTNCSQCKFYELSGFLWDSMKTVTFLWYWFMYYAFMHLLYFWYILIHTLYIVTHICICRFFLHGQAARSKADRACFGKTVCVQAHQLGDLSHAAWPLWALSVDNKIGLPYQAESQPETCSPWEILKFLSPTSRLLKKVWFIGAPWSRVVTRI